MPFRIKSWVDRGYNETEWNKVDWETTAYLFSEEKSDFDVVGLDGKFN